MSCRDPWMNLAERVLQNLSSWWVEAHLAEPRAAAPSPHQLQSPGPPKPGYPKSPVEAFAERGEELLAVLRPVRRRIRKLKARLRQVYRLRYVEGMTYAEIVRALVPQAGERSVERYVWQIRACVAATLRRQPPERLELIWGLIHAQERLETSPW